LPAGGSLDLKVQVTAGSAGNLQVTATFNQVVVDADQRAPVDVAAASTSSVQVQTAGALAIQIRAPQLVEGFRSQLTVDISNTGGAEIAGVGLGVRLRSGLDARHELDEHHRRAVAHPARQARRAGEAGRTIGVALGEIGEELLHDLLLRKPADGLAARDQRAVLPENDHAVDERADLFGLRLGGLHALVAKHRKGQVAEHPAPCPCASPELALVYLMRH